MAMTPRRPSRRQNPEAAAVRMPACRYGVHCQLSGCVYRHPTAEEAARMPSKSVCLSFLSGTCEFGDNCWHWHPKTVGERQAILRVLKQRPCTNPKPCPFGADCLFRCPL